MSPRTGRPPLDNAKRITVKGRIDAKTNARLKEYCEKHNVTITEVIRQGIEIVLEKE